MTHGHTDLIKRAAGLFDALIVAVAASPHKSPIFDLDQRIGFVRHAVSALNNVQVIGFDSLLADFAREHDANIILRGLRAVSDFEYEFQLASMNRHLIPQAETVFLTPAEQYSFISSSLVTEIARLGGDVSNFVGADVVEALKQRFQQ